MVREWPETIELVLHYRGKGSEEPLYDLEKSIPFNKLLESKFVARNHDWSERWDVRDIVRKVYADIILDECRKALVAARKEQHIVCDGGDRITGDYIVAVDASVNIGSWKKLSYEEYLLIKAEQLNNKRKVLEDKNGS